MPSEVENANTLEVAGDWANEANFTGAHDGNCMNTTTANDVSGEFSFNFTDVAGTIDGIEVLIHYEAGDNNDFVDVELYDSTSVWRMKSVPTIGVGGASCADCADQTVGGATDLWGGTWTDTHIKSTSFRIRVTAKASAKGGGNWWADHCTVTVYYTEEANLVQKTATIGITMTRDPFQITKPKTANIGITESDIRSISATRIKTADIGITETREPFQITKPQAIDVGITESFIRELTATRSKSADVGITESFIRALTATRTKTATVGIGATKQIFKTKMIIKTANIGITESFVREFTGTRTKSATVGITASPDKFITKPMTATVGITGSFVKQFTTTLTKTANVGITETFDKQIVVTRTQTATIGITESVDKGVGIAKSINIGIIASEYLEHEGVKIGLLTVSFLDRFIEKNGDSITRKRPTSKVFNVYGELDFDNTTWDDATSMMVLEPESKTILSTERAGLVAHGGMIRGQVKSDLDIVIGDFVLYNNMWFRVISVGIDGIKNFKVKHVELRHKDV